jgi:hypothetical protein
LIHLGFASATALASAMIPIVIAVLQGVATPGINIVGMTMLLQFVVSFGFILVVNAPQNMVAYGTETFEAKDFVRTGLALTVIALALARLCLSETARELIATQGMTSNQAFNASIGSLFRCGGRCKIYQVQGTRTGGGKMFGWFVGIVISAVVMSSGALSQQSFQQLESVSQFEQALAAVDAIKHRKHLQCVIAIANRALCQCLSRKLPVNIYFRSYVSIANQEKDGLEYGQLSATEKKIVDQCVSDSR